MTTQRQILKWLSVGLLALPCFAEEATPHTLRLRSAAVTASTTPTLGDVLTFDDPQGALALAVAAEPLPIPAGTAREVEVTQTEVRARLDALGVNAAQVLLGGALACRVQLPQPAPTAPAAPPAPGAPLIRPVSQTAPDGLAPNGETTLADILQRHVASELQDLGGQVELTFDRAGGEFLTLTTPPWDFDISSRGKNKLGLREFRVTIRRDGRTQRTVHMFAQVKLERQIVVAARPLSLGNFVQREDVQTETRIIDDEAALGVSDIGTVIGQQIKRYVPVGEAVSSDALKAVDLVQRSRPVTVLSPDSAVQLRLTGVALDNGGLGDTVRVRLGASRTDRRQVRGVVTGMATVRLMEP